MTKLQCVTLPQHPDVLFEALYPVATPDRRQRADRCVRREDGLRCLVAGELLRRVVAQELEIQEYRVIVEPDGKPRVAGFEDFHFNLTHSGRHVAIAWGNTPLGVDVQLMRTDVKQEKLARAYFTKEEQDYILQFPAHMNDRFYRVWTGKESYLKYLGTGLKKSLSSFSIFDPEIAPLLQTRYLEDGYCLTLCAADPDCIFEVDYVFFR
jgi:4'-phosphopantetheinyl transferase